MSLVVHGRVVVNELAKGLLAELGRQVLLVAVKQVPNTIALLKQKLLRILIANTSLNRNLIFSGHYRGVLPSLDSLLLDVPKLRYLFSGFVRASFPLAIGTGSACIEILVRDW